MANTKAKLQAAKNVGEDSLTTLKRQRDVLSRIDREVDKNNDSIVRADKRQVAEVLQKVLRLALKPTLARIKHDLCQSKPNIKT